MFHIAKAIMTLQTLYGIIPNIYGKGKYAKVGYKIFLSLFLKLLMCFKNKDNYRSNI